MLLYTQMVWNCNSVAVSINFRKICRNCKCGQEEHDIPSSNEEDRKVGKLFEDTKYTTLIAKLKSDSSPMYKRNVMILTSPVPAKNVSADTVTYEWTPPVQNQTLVSPTHIFSCSRQELVGDKVVDLTGRLTLCLVVFLSSSSKLKIWCLFNESCICHHASWFFVCRNS